VLRRCNPRRSGDLEIATDVYVRPDLSAAEAESAKLHPGAEAAAAKAQPQNVQAQPSRIVLEPKLK